MFEICLLFAALSSPGDRGSRLNHQQGGYLLGRDAYLDAPLLPPFPPV
jgi:hypothetical protein